MSTANADVSPSSGGGRRWGHLPGLDGIRALAVMGVLLYHADVPWMPGGFLGVDVFFVLSGFLITSLLLLEVGASGRINLKRFYQRRMRRLFPALLAVLLLTSLLAATIARDAAATLLRDLPPALLYVLNWSYVLREQSYFEAMGRPPMLQHLWSLAVEEQFYIIWPLVTLAAWRFKGRSGVLVTALVGAVFSSIAMVWLSIAGEMPVPNDASRVYFGTDTHAAGILMGAALAAVWRPHRIRRDLHPGAKALVDGVGVAALLAVIAFFVMATEYSEALYRGGFTLLAAITVLLVAAVTHPASRVGPGLGMRPLKWVGDRSYGIYLWHWPLFLVTRPGEDIPWVGPWVDVVRIVLVFAVADVSYRFLETPLRRNGMSAVRSFADSLRAAERPRLAAGLGLATALSLITVIGLATAPRQVSGTDAAAVAARTGLPIDAVEGLPPDAILTPDGDTGDDSESPTPQPTPSGNASSDPSASPSGASPSGASPSGSTSTQDPATADNRWDSTPVFAYGDSVILGATPALKKKYKDFRVDAAVSRHIYVVHDAIRRDKAWLKGLVIVHTGNNGPLTEKALRSMLTTLSGAQRVVLINQSMPRRWEEPNNELYAKVVPDFPNVRIADWHALSQGHRDWFVSDRVHTNWTGARAYTKLVRATAVAP